MREFFKQLFCKHEYEDVYVMGNAVDFGGILEVTDLIKVKKCKKCGKIFK